MRFDLFRNISHIDNFEHAHRDTPSRGDSEYLKQKAEERLQKNGKATVVRRKGCGVLGMTTLMPGDQDKEGASGRHNCLERKSVRWD